MLFHAQLDQPFLMPTITSLILGSDGDEYSPNYGIFHDIFIYRPIIVQLSSTLLFEIIRFYNFEQQKSSGNVLGLNIRRQISPHYTPFFCFS